MEDAEVEIYGVVIFALYDLEQWFPTSAAQ